MEEDRVKGKGDREQRRFLQNDNPSQAELPFASDEEFKRRVVHYADIPLTQMA